MTQRSVIKTLGLTTADMYRDAKHEAVNAFAIRECTTRAEFDTIIACMWRAFEEPFHPWLRIVAPVFGSSEEDYAAALKSHQERSWIEHTQDTNSAWLYAVVDTSQQVVGAAEWKVFRTNPYEDGCPRIKADWWPSGEQRDFAELCMNQMNDPRGTKMSEPHTLLETMFVIPEYRGRGVGSALMRFGVDTADQLNIESFIEASPMAQPLYARFGYQTLYQSKIDAEKEHPSDEWIRLKHELTHFTWFFMVRPRTRGVEP